MPYSYIAPRDKAKIVKIHEVKNQITELFSCETVTELCSFRPVTQVGIFLGPDDTFFRFLAAYGLRAPPIA